MKKSIMAGAVCIMSFVLAHVSYAATVVTDASGTVATGVLGLDINGATYNVSFTARSSYDDIYTGTPTFLNDQAGAEAAVDAIIAALNVLDAVELTGTGAGAGNNDNEFFVPWLLSGGDVSSAWGYNPFGNGNTHDWKQAATFTLPTDATTIPWTEFTLVPVPVPAAIWLFGSGLVGLAGVARRKT